MDNSFDFDMLNQSFVNVHVGTGDISTHSLSNPRRGPSMSPSRLLKLDRILKSGENFSFCQGCNLAASDILTRRARSLENLLIEYEKFVKVTGPTSQQVDRQESQLLERLLREDILEQQKLYCDIKGHIETGSEQTSLVDTESRATQSQMDLVLRDICELERRKSENSKEITDLLKLVQYNQVEQSVLQTSSPFESLFQIDLIDDDSSAVSMAVINGFRLRYWCCPAVNLNWGEIGAAWGCFASILSAYRLLHGFEERIEIPIPFAALSQTVARTVGLSTASLRSQPVYCNLRLRPLRSRAWLLLQSGLFNTTLCLQGSDSSSETRDYPSAVTYFAIFVIVTCLQAQRLDCLTGDLEMLKDELMRKQSWSYPCLVDFSKEAEYLEIENDSLPSQEKEKEKQSGLTIACVTALRRLIREM